MWNNAELLARELLIGDTRIADDALCYIVTELGQNHQGEVVTARRLIHAAAAAGATAVKLQKRDVDHLYTAAMLASPYAHEHSFGETYGQHRRALELSLEAYAVLQQSAGAAGVTLFATAFDEVSADGLVSLRMPAIKLASGALTDRHLIQHVASLGLPVLLSTGGGTQADVDTAVQWFDAVRPAVGRLALLHCTAAYPCAFDELNFNCLRIFRQRYPSLVIGLSGHDSGIAMALIAWSFGARIIEKHFTLNRAMKGGDHSFSLEPAGLTKLVRDIRRAEVAMGDGVKCCYQSELAPLAKMRRTLQENGQWQITGDLLSTVPTVGLA